MSTIAYRDDVIAADTQVTWNGRADCHVSKIRRFGSLLAGAGGSASMARRFFDWLATGAVGDPPALTSKEHQLDAFIVMPNGLIVQYDGEGIFYSQSQHYAVGSGATLARGAMEAGASAQEAVAIASRIDVNTGGQVHVLWRDGRAT